MEKNMDKMDYEYLLVVAVNSRRTDPPSPEMIDLFSFLVVRYLSGAMEIGIDGSTSLDFTLLRLTLVCHPKQP